MLRAARQDDEGIPNGLPGSASADKVFHQFTKLSPELRRRVWRHACPELTAEARFISFEIEEERQQELDGNDFILYDHPDLLPQTLDVVRLSALCQETRALVKEVLPDSIRFKHRKYDFSECRVGEDDEPRLLSVIDGLVHYRKETDILWLDVATTMKQFCYPAHLNTFRLGDDIKETLNVGFKLPGGRSTMLDPMKPSLCMRLLEQFPKLQAFYYGIAADELVDQDKEEYMDWCFAIEDYREYGFTWILNTNNIDDGRDIIWRWPSSESVTEGLVPRVISKSVKDLESDAARLGWKLIPVFEFEDEFHYKDMIFDAERSFHLPVLPQGSEMSEDEQVPSDEDDDIMTLDGDDYDDDELFADDINGFAGGSARRRSICGSRPNPLPHELRDWGVEDKEKGYQDSDAGEPEEEGTELRAFHKFAELPIELRYRIWELYCPDITAPARVYEFDIGCFRTVLAPLDFKVYEGVTTRSVTRKIRKVLSVNQESRRLVLKALPDTLDFRIPPHNEIMMKGDVSADPPSSLRFRKETDVVFLRQPPEWQFSEDELPLAEQGYSLQGFASVLQNLAVLQPPQVILRDDHLCDIKHLLEQLPNLVNYYYVVPPHLTRARYMTWCLAPEATRYKHTMVPDPDLSHEMPIEKEIWCWLTKEAADKLKVPHRVEEMACRLKNLAAEKGINLMPMTVVNGRRDQSTYVDLVEEEERARLRVEAGEPEDPDSDEDGTHENEQFPIEAIIGAIMNGTIPGGMQALGALLTQAGVDPHALDDVYAAFQDNMMEVDDDDDGWEDEDDLF